MPATSKLLMLAPLLCLFASGAMAQLPVGVNISYAIFPHTGGPGDLTLSEPVFLVYGIENRLPEAISVDLSDGPYRAFRMSLTRPDGRVAQPVKRLGGITVAVVKSIPPLNKYGEKYAEKLLLNTWFDFDSPGDYTLDVELTTPILVNGRAVPYPTAGHITFTVGNRDAARLTEICGRLQRQATLPGPGRARAAETLSYVIDPVAVPYLGAMLGDNTTEFSAIEGLARIGDAASIDALISQGNHPDYPTRALVHYSLIRIQSRIQDEALKQKISDELERARTLPRPPRRTERK
jgi:hypothetical protein